MDTLLQLRSWIKRRYGNSANTSCTALLSAGILQLTEIVHSVVYSTSRTYHFLRAAREYQRAVQNNPNTLGHATQIRRMSITVGSATQQASVPSLGIVPSWTKEVEEITAWAGLRLEDAASESLVDRLYAEQCSG